MAPMTNYHDLVTKYGSVNLLLDAILAGSVPYEEAVYVSADQLQARASYLLMHAVIDLASAIRWHTSWQRTITPPTT